MQSSKERGSTMAKKLLESSALSAFCESMALMLSAGIQMDEAVSMLAENMKDTPFKRACDDVFVGLSKGEPLATAMEVSGAFPAYAVETIAVGEKAGRLEAVLRALGSYYDEEDRLFRKIRTSIGHPAALLWVMVIILAFTVFAILPVFGNMYRSFAGGGAAGGAFDMMSVSTTIGYVALVVTVILAVAALIAWSSTGSERGRERVLRWLAHVPATRQAMYQLALSRFTSAVAIYTASGINTDDAMKDALATVEHGKLRAKVQNAYEAMTDPTTARSMAQAIADFGVFEPVYARMLLVGSRAGSLDAVLERLSDTFFDDAIGQVDRAVDGIEPALAAFITVVIGVTLISVMLPLVGIMGSIG